MRFSHGLLLTGMTLLSARSLTGHPDDADHRAALDALIASVPDSADLYLRRAAHSADHRQWAEAESDLRRAAQLEPNSAKVRVVSGRIYLAAGKLREARNQLDSALATVPAQPEALVLRARVHSQLGEINAAHTDYNSVIALLEEPSPSLYLERAALPIASLAALRGLDDGIARLGPTPALVERAIALELRLGRIDAALARLDLLAAHAERKEVFLKRRGDLFALAGRATEARGAYLQALASLEALPNWLRDSAESTRLLLELKRLAHSTT
ncbi:MAG: tetratricopeptide repeat protein [Opitutaceae bacterium]